MSIKAHVKMFTIPVISCDFIIIAMQTTPLFQVQQFCESQIKASFANDSLEMHAQERIGLINNN